MIATTSWHFIPWKEAFDKALKKILLMDQANVAAMIKLDKWTGERKFGETLKFQWPYPVEASYLLRQFDRLGWRVGQRIAIEKHLGAHMIGTIKFDESEDEDGFISLRVSFTMSREPVRETETKAS